MLNELVNKANQIAKEHIKDTKLSSTFIEIAKQTVGYLGNVHHICANDYLKKDGVILWTDHGIGHTIKVMENTRNLLPIIDWKYNKYEMFVLFSAALTHDIGMFIRLVEGDIYEQRRYHGRLSEIVLGNIYSSQTNRNMLEAIDVWYIGTLARLHQTKEYNNFIERIGGERRSISKPFTSNKIEEPRKFINHGRLAKLGGLILLADSLDINKKRCNQDIYKAFQDVIGQVNPRSNAEWLTNQVVNKYKISCVDNKIIASFIIDPDNAMEPLELDIEKNGNYQKRIAGYFLSFLWRYIHDSHFSHFKDSFKKAKLKININKDNFKQKSILESKETKPLKDNSSEKSYDKEWRFWFEGLSNLYLGRDEWLELSKICKDLKFKTAFIMIKDELRSAIRIFVPADFKNDYAWQEYAMHTTNIDKVDDACEKFRDVCLSVRIPEKYSVIGHVWYRGLPEYIKFDVNKKGRMVSSDIDIVLGLKNAFYFPFISPDKKNQKQNILRFILVFNNPNTMDSTIACSLREFCEESWNDYISNTENARLPIVDINPLCKKIESRLLIAQPTEENI